MQKIYDEQNTKILNKVEISREKKDKNCLKNYMNYFLQPVKKWLLHHICTLSFQTSDFVRKNKAINLNYSYLCFFLLATKPSS